MEYKNNERNSAIFSIAEILGKMSNQVGFLIRNNKLMSQLDVDMLMDNTRKLYDTICSVRCNMDVDSIPMEVESNEGAGADAGAGTGADEVWNFTDDDDIVEDDVEDDFVDKEKEDSEIRTEELEVEEENHMTGEETEIEETEDEYEDDEVEIGSEISSQEDEAQTYVEDSGIRAYKKVNNEYYTLGDVLEQTEDNSLAARLQKKPIADLTTAVGINDKFLLLNELFGGSMEKYNKSIRALNNFSTLLGAKTYMSELQIEFQWDCESDAYKKLNDLVERRFI